MKLNKDNCESTTEKYLSYYSPYGRFSFFKESNKDKWPSLSKYLNLPFMNSKEVYLYHKNCLFTFIS